MARLRVLGYKWQLSLKLLTIQSASMSQNQSIKFRLGGWLEDDGGSLHSLGQSCTKSGLARQHLGAAAPI